MRTVINLFTGTDACGAVCSALVHLRHKDRDSITVRYCDQADEEVNELLNLIELAEEQGQVPECERQIIVCGTVIRHTTKARLERFCGLKAIKLRMYDAPGSLCFFNAARWLYYYLSFDVFGDELAGLAQFIEDIGQEQSAKKMTALGLLLPPHTLELVLSNHFTLSPDLSFSPEDWLMTLIENPLLLLKGEHHAQHICLR